MKFYYLSLDIWGKFGFGLNIALKKSYFDIMLYSMMMGYDDYKIKIKIKSGFI